MVFNTTGLRIMLIGSSFWHDFRYGWRQGRIQSCATYFLSPLMGAVLISLTTLTHPHTHPHIPPTCVCAKWTLDPETHHSTSQLHYNFILNSSPVSHEANRKWLLSFMEMNVCVCVCVCVCMKEREREKRGKRCFSQVSDSFPSNVWDGQSRWINRSTVKMSPGPYSF